MIFLRFSIVRLKYQSKLYHGQRSLLSQESLGDNSQAGWGSTFWEHPVWYGTCNEIHKNLIYHESGLNHFTSLDPNLLLIKENVKNSICLQSIIPIVQTKTKTHRDILWALQKINCYIKSTRQVLLRWQLPWLARTLSSVHSAPH